ncbi:MAG: hypothetical protein ABGZ23_02685 [Fuerstiella sp.]
MLCSQSTAMRGSVSIVTLPFNLMVPAIDAGVPVDFPLIDGLDASA